MLGVPMLLAAVAISAPSGAGTALKADLQRYLNAHRAAEHISAATLSVSFGNGKMLDVAAGTTAYGGGQPVTPQSLFQIGSNTKAFTATLMLKLQTDNALSVGDTLGRWLPQYAPWQAITIHRLLDMTGGIETYDDVPAMLEAYSAKPFNFFSDAELVSYVDPRKPLQPGWHYSNTGYILASMIAQKASGGTSYADLLRSRVIAPAKIADLYYYPGIYPANLRARTVQGYFYSRDPDNAGLAPLFGKSVRDYSTSWAQAAGGIVATAHAVALWARDLYQGPILTTAERSELETLVSSKTGKPIEQATEEDPGGFGLGVSQVYKPGLGRIWFYEGETLGYRMVHVYFPEQNLVFAFGLNSQPDKAQDHVGDLILSVVKTLKKYGLF